MLKRGKKKKKHKRKRVKLGVNLSVSCARRGENALTWLGNTGPALRCRSNGLPFRGAPGSLNGE